MKTKPTTIATLGSHSALDVCRGAVQENFATLVVCQKGREKTYSQYFKKKGAEGCVNEVITLEKFDQILSEAVQTQLVARNAIFIPNRSFEVYLHNDYDAIETRFQVPLFGNKHLLRMEERTGEMSQYAILEKAGIRAPKVFKRPEDIDRLCIVKAQQKERKFERAFFFAASFSEYETKLAELITSGMIEKAADWRIEEYLLGAQVNLNFFYSPLQGRLELIGTDTRRQTNVSGLTSLPAHYQHNLPEATQITFEEAGHTAVTILESLLEPTFELGEQFVAAARQFHPLGIIGPFSLQTMIVPGAKNKEFVVFDVSPRMPGSPGITATPYTTYLYGKPISMGQRVALEIKAALAAGALEEITT